MAAHDIRDVLNLPADGAGPRPSKKQKTSAARTNLKGLAREVQSLGGDNPIAIVPEISTFKKRRFGSRKPAAKWVLSPFQNSARDDNQALLLRHWRKQTEDLSRTTSQPEQPQPQTEGDAAEPSAALVARPTDLEDSAFAKYNVRVDVPQYSDELYESALTSTEWTKEETDYLFDLARDFDLRWSLVWDRYEYTPKQADAAEDGENTDVTRAIVPATRARTLEDLKFRYYDVVARMMAAQKKPEHMTSAEYDLYQKMNNYNPQSELQRKRFAEASLSRSKEEAREEESLLVEVRRILARTEKFNQERRDLYDRLDYPQAENDINAFKTSAGLQNLLQTLMNVDKSKKRKSIMEANANAQTPASSVPQSAQPASTPVSESRRESTVAPPTAGGHRDSVSNADRPERPAKKGAPPAPQLERKKLTEDEERIYGVSHHDRLHTGPTFRYEKINKILTTKSHAQHQRIINTLLELDIPSRLNMPTRPVVEEMEKLLNSIGVLLDLRKVSDKVDGELKIEQMKKAERDKANGIVPAEPTMGASAESKAEGDTAVAGSDTTAEAGSGSSNVNGSGDVAAQEDKQAEGADKETDDAGEGTDMKKKEVAVKQEAGEDKAARPGSSGRHKRSASEVSTVSDKSTKRQKK
ncbi:DNA methyltransferase 1-associated protein 1 [Microdochium nivale]|nr:DNA methyltransferase 1-associated protein 1 [Microdochium nivale]